MKYLTLAVLFFSIFAIESGANDGTVSVLKTPAATQAASSEPVTTVSQPSQVVVAPCTGDSPSLTYSNKDKIAPCANQKNGCLSYCKEGCDACCNKTFEKVNVEVPICVPPCASKQSVTRSKNGRRAVYDYGKYEVVLRADKDDNINVKYRKRILDR